MHLLKKILKSYVFLFLLLASTILGQTKVITLEGAIQTALKSNRQIQIAKLNVEKSEKAVSEAFGYALPSVDLSANFSRFLTKPKMSFPDFKALLTNSTYGILFDEGILPEDKSKFLPIQNVLQTFAQRNNYSADLKITQILFNSAVFRGIGASQIYLNLSKEQLKSEISKTVLNVKKAYYGALLAKDLLKISEERYVNAKEHLRNIKAMKGQGLVSDFNEMQAEVQVENIRPVLLKMENIYKNAKNGLKILLGVDQATEIKLTGDMKYSKKILPGEEEIINRAVKSNFDLNTLKIKNQLDDEFAAIDRGGYWPTLAAFGAYSFAGNSENWNFSNYNSSTIGLSFSINLFQGGRTLRKVQQDEITGLQTKEQIATLRDATVSQIKAKLNDLKRVQAQIEAMNNNIKLAERAYQIAEDRYKQGTGSELEVKDANVSLSQARVNSANAVHDYLIAKAELDNLLGAVDQKYFDEYKDYLEN